MRRLFISIPTKLKEILSLEIFVYEKKVVIKRPVSAPSATSTGDDQRSIPT